MSDEKAKVLEQLLGGYQRHVTTASRAWTTLAILSLYAAAAALLPVAEAEGEQGASLIDLPLLDDVRMQRHWFILTTTGIMAALIVRWVEALSRAVHTRRELVEPLLLDSHCDHQGLKVSPKRLWDAQVALGTSTVWSAPAALLKFRWQVVRLLAFPYLVLLKLLSAIVHYGIPGVIMWLLAASFSLPTSTDARGLQFPYVLLWVLVSTGLLQLAFGLIAETRYSIESLRQMWTQARRNSK